MKKQLLLLMMMLLPMIASAYDAYVDGIYYNLNKIEKTAEVTCNFAYDYNRSSYSGTICIPSTISYNGDTYSVTGITSQAFMGCTGLISVTIPTSVTRIGDYAFYDSGWYNNQPDGILYLDNWLITHKGEQLIGNVEIIDGTRGIADYAFSGCEAVTTISIPNSVTNIGKSAFSSCSGLISINIPNGLTCIEGGTFAYCENLISITIPNSVTCIKDGDYIGSHGVVTDYGGAFRNCSNLTSVAIPNSVTYIGNGTFSGCSSMAFATIPNSVTRIGASAFADCSCMTSVNIPNSLTNIENNTFAYCTNLSSITIPNSVTTIGRSAFYGCRSLVSVIIPNGVTNIETSAFAECSGLTSITIPYGVTTIGDATFSECGSLTSIAIPNSVTSIGGQAFYRCYSLSSVHISDIASWCNISFGNDMANPLSYAHHLYNDDEEIVDLVIPSSVTSIGKYTFFGFSELTSVTIPNSVTTIGESAFENCSSLESVSLPNDIVIIKRNTFCNCSNLKSITIPVSIEYIYQEAFAYCTSLEGINAQPTTPPFIYNNSFSDFSVPVNVPNGCVDAYRAAQGWSNFTNITDGNLNYQITVNVGNNGSVTFGTETVTNGSEMFDVKDGNDAVLTITPETGYQVSTLTVNGEDVKSQLTNGVLTISNVTANMTVEVTFELISGYTESIKMSVPSGDRTAIGYSSSLGLDFTGIEDVKAWIVTGFTDDANVLLSRVRIVPPYTGLYLTSNVAGIEVDVPTTDKDIYYANLLKAAVEEETIQPTETHDGVEFTNFVVGKLTSGEMGFVRVKTARTLGPNKSRLLVPSSYYPVANTAHEFNVEFLDDDATTDIKGNEAVRQTANQLYDLQGRLISASQARKGIYIYKGKKYVIK